MNPRVRPYPEGVACGGLTPNTSWEEQPMKKTGTSSRAERDSTTTEKRGIAFSDSPALFMMIPPTKIPTASEGRFTAPAKPAANQRGPFTDTDQ